MSPLRRGVVLASLVALGCGARSGLHDDGRCVEQQHLLPPPASQAMLLLDESDSMGWDLRGQPFVAPSRWSIVRGVLRESLVRYDPSVALGLWTFPADGAQLCATRDAPRLPFARNNTARLMAVIDADAPHGLTPTGASIQRVARYFATLPPPAAPRSVVLLTDGGPNCNTALDPRRCVCAVTTQPTCASAEQCLDDVATLAQITALSRAGVGTFVLGIDGGGEAALVDVLNRMAVAGGHPRASDEGTRYYSIQRAEDLAAALEAIRPEVAGCDREAPLRTDDARVELDGAPLARDLTHRDGWDWATPSGSTLRLYGPSCRRSLDASLRLRVGCE